MISKNNKLCIMKLNRLILGNRESIIKNVIIWILVYTMVALPFGIEIATALIIPLIIPVHVNYLLLDKYFKKKRYIQYGIFVILLVFIFGFLAQGLSSNIILTKFEYINPIITKIPEELLHIAERPVLKFAFNPLIAIVLTGFYRNYQEKQYNIIQELKTQHLKAELAFLKGQINPHFLFNVLNNLLSMSTLKGDVETAKGIGHLSQLMRYMLYNTNSEYVHLENEIDMLENFIDLQKLRIDEKSIGNIKLVIKGNPTKKRIPPMLLIPFIENAFKHGYSVNREFSISILIHIYNDNLHFSVENTVNKARQNKNMDSSGIGLENVRKRLDLLYKDEYLLEINENEKHYINLKIPLKN